jgi:hypothetical protein
MMNGRSWLIVGLVAASVLLVGCEQSQAESVEDRPAQVAPVDGAGVSRVTLTAEAAGRIGLQTTPVQMVSTPGAGAPNAAVPMAAVIYARDGSTWVYTSSAPLTYVRQRVTVARVTGDVALLQAGPAPGTAVVTVGAAELLGSEYGVEGR